MKVATSLLVVIASAFIPPQAHGQQSMKIRVDKLCADCRIEVKQTARLGEGGSFQVTGYPGIAVRDAKGNIYATQDAPALIHIFDRNGKFVRLLGRKGSGPGEYERVQKVLLAERDRVLVLDAVLGRITHFGGNGKVIRSYPFQGGSVMHSATLPNGNFIVNADFFSREAAGYLIQEFTPEGRSVRLFALDDQSVSNAPHKRERLLASNSSGQVLSMMPFAYVLDVFSPSGALTRTFRREADWFPPLPPSSRPTGGTDKEEPSARVVAMWTDAEGLLWTVSLVPKPNWRTESPKPNQYKSIIEVIDLNLGSLVAKAEIPQRVAHGLGDGGVVAYGEDKDGFPWIDVFEFQLKKPLKRE